MSNNNSNNKSNRKSKDNEPMQQQPPEQPQSETLAPEDAVSGYLFNGHYRVDF